jgi:peroxiredoxin
MSLQIGDQAPDFTLLSDQNERISLQALRGKKLFCIFIPKTILQAAPNKLLIFVMHCRDLLSKIR